MKIGQYCQRQRCKHVELEQFWQAFASRGFVGDSWAFLFFAAINKLRHPLTDKYFTRRRAWRTSMDYGTYVHSIQAVVGR